MKKIELHGKYGRGKFALVDDDDFVWLRKRQWSLDPNGYVFTTLYTKQGKPVNFPMHRVILKTPARMLSDHIDHNGLNNQKNNLRVVTNSQNQMNRKSNKCTSSKFKGVSWHNRDKIWRAQIKINGKYSYIGTFKSEVGAAKAYNARAIELFGEFAHLNKIPLEA